MIEPSNDKNVIVSILNSFAKRKEHHYWEMKCTYCNGLGTTYNEICIFDATGLYCEGQFLYQVETGMVIFCRYKQLEKQESENIVDMLLDMMNYPANSIS